MDYQGYCDELEREGARVVALSAGAEMNAAVPGCPLWRVSDLLEHLGSVHRWAQHLVAVRAPSRISRRDMGFSRGPVGAPWLEEGLAELLATLRASEPDDAMWAWGADQHVRFWARRQLHETLVHRVDLEQALAVTSDVEPVVGADAIDEFLVNLQHDLAISPDARTLAGNGETLVFRTDEGPRWCVQLTHGGFIFGENGGHVDAQITGPTRDLLLTLCRRIDLAASGCTVSGDESLVATWLSQSGFD